MNEMLRVVTASEDDRRGLFQTTAQRLGCAPENVEKDFWVCWTLDALYNKAGIKPRLLFKGGTSLSKAWDKIRRFSEDIDITVFRTDFVGEKFPSDVELMGLSRKQREAQLERIKETCQAYIAGPFREALLRVATEELGAMPFGLDGDPEDPDGQSLLFRYPSVFENGGADYIRRVVKIESGAKSALDPHEVVSIKPYIAGDVAFNLEVPGVRTIIPERTLWDKLVILHGQRRWFENKGVPFKDAQRLSRHYYDVYSLLQTKVGDAALANLDMGEDCVRHARTFFNRAPLDLDSAVPGSFALVPPPAMLPYLQEDYRRMADMIFGDAPPFAEILIAIAAAEERLNTPVLSPA